MNLSFPLTRTLNDSKSHKLFYVIDFSFANLLIDKMNFRLILIIFLKKKCFDLLDFRGFPFHFIVLLVIKLKYVLCFFERIVLNI